MGVGESNRVRSAVPPESYPEGTGAKHTSRGPLGEGSARGAILRAVEQLEEALPRDAELMMPLTQRMRTTWSPG